MMEEAKPGADITEKTAHNRIRILQEAFYHHKKAVNTRLDELERNLLKVMRDLNRFSSEIQRLREKVEFPDV